jgi:hypothetical protein
MSISNKINIKYNIYLNSPQLAVNANRKKYYLQVIQNNNNYINRPFQNYTPSYYKTSYSRILFPVREILPY